MRHAIYFTPPSDHALTRHAAAWLGRDAFAGNDIAQPRVEGFDGEEFSRLTADARRYGFHATFKAPFHLAGDRSEAELIEALDRLAAGLTPFAIPHLVLGRLGPFFALVPDGHNADLQVLCDSVVRDLDGFRAPLDPADRARRKPETLSDSQRRHLDAWGYPYVFEEFRFHMTLTGPVPEHLQQAMQRALEIRFADFLGRPLEVAHLALFVEPAPGDAFLIRHLTAPLGANPEKAK